MSLEKTCQIAIEKGIIKSKSIIIDSTHTKSRYTRHSIREVLQEQSKKTDVFQWLPKKADAALLEKIQNGSVSINKAHEMIKAAEARKKAREVKVPAETVSNTGKGINSDSFKLGVLFVLSELKKSLKYIPYGISAIR